MSQRFSDPFRDLISYYVNAEISENNVDLLKRFGGDLSDQKKVGRSGLLDNDYHTVPPNTALSDLLTVTSSWAFPRLLTDRLAACQVTCNTGYFSEIGRAWLAVDGWLALWKPNDTSGNSILSLDRVQQWGRSILSVGIVSPKPGVFRDGLLSHIICVGTTDDVHILGVVSQRSSDDGVEEHQLTDVLMSCSTDGVAMQDLVCCSKNGRIFSAGIDGHIYEIEYNAVDTWWTPKLRIVNLTSSWFPISSVSSVFGFSRVDPLKQLLLDSERRILYSRSENNAISAYSLGENMDAFYHLGTVHLCEAKKAADRIFGEAVATSSHFQNVVDMSIIPSTDSTSLHLVAVTDSGCRIFFSSPTRVSPDFYIRHLRLPPGYTPSVTERPSSVYSMGCISGFDIMFTVVQTRATPASPGLLSRVASVDQTVAWVYASGAKSTILNPPVSSVGENTITGEFVSPTSMFLGRVLHVSLLNKMDSPEQTQPSCVKRYKLLAITDGVIHVIETVSLVDQFRCLVSMSSVSNERTASQPGREIARLASVLGPVRLCTLALASLTFDPSRIQCDPQLVLACLNKYGIQALPSACSTPASQSRLGQSQHWMQNSLIHGSNSPAPQTAANLCQNDFQAWKTSTPRSDAIAMSTAMLLCPIWHSTIVTKKQQRTVEKVSSPGKQLQLKSVFESRVSSSYLSSTARVLRSIIEIINRFVPATANQPLVRGHQQTMNPLSHEPDELRRWIIIIERLVQITNLLSIVSEHDIDALMQRGCESNEVQAVFASITMNQWLTANLEDDNSVTSAFISALFRLYDLAGSDTGPLSNRLEASCPALYTKLERVYAKALRLLVAADKAAVDRRPELLQQAVALLREVAPHLNLTPVCQHLVRLGCYPGVLDVCLEAARVLDPHSLALIHLRNGRPVNDNAGRAALDVRHQCYAPIAQMLNILLVESGGPGQSLDQVLKMVARVPDDPVFHYFVYDWLLDKNMSDRLLGAHLPDASVYPFADEYLKMCLSLATSIDEGQQHGETNASMLPGGLNAESLSELLVNVYIKQQRNADAAELLARMAEDDSLTSSLSDRIARLSRAILCLRSIASADEQLANSQLLLGELSDKLEAAHHQEKLAERVASAAKASDASALLRKHADVALSQLNARLLSVQQMYDIAATPELRIPDACLPLLRFANITDSTVIKEVWKGVVDTLLIKYGHLCGSDQAKVSMAEEFATISSQHVSSDLFFPLDFIMLQLEFAAIELSFGSGWVPKLFLESLNIPITHLLSIYKHAVSNRMQYWESVGQPLHLVESAVYVIHHAIKLIGGQGVSGVERARIRDFCDQFLDECRVEISQSLTLMGDDGSSCCERLLLTINEMKSSLHKEISAPLTTVASPYAPTGISSPAGFLATRTPKFGAL